MAKKKQASRWLRLFYPPDPYDPIDNAVAAAGNVVATLGLEWLARDVTKKLGLGGASVQDQLNIDRSKLYIKKVEVEVAQAERKQAEAMLQAEQLKLKQQHNKLLSEKQLRLLDLRIEEKEVEIDKARNSLGNLLGQRTEVDLHIMTEPVAGTLEVTANPSGLTGSTEQQEGYKAWLDSFEAGKVVLILGKRGSGKSALTGKMAEYMMAIHRLPCYWIGLPEQARDMLPHWVKITDTPEKVPVNSFLVCDESGIAYLSLLFNTTQNRFMRRLLMIARQRHISLAFAAQSSRDIDWSIVRQADTVIYKEPGLNQPETERTDLRRKAMRAAAAFKEMPKEERVEAAYVCDADFEGMIKFNLPSFWTEEFSHIYSHLDLTKIENQVQGADDIDKSIEGEANVIEDSTLDRDILELRQQGYGIEKIAKTVGCTIWRVRKCLNI